MPDTKHSTKPKRTTLPMRFSPKLLSELDGRLGIAKHLRERYDALVLDTNADSEQKRMLCKRVVFLETLIETWECQFIEDGIDGEQVGRYVQACNSLQGVLKSLGLNRQRKAKSLNEILEEYKEEKTNE